MSVPFDVLSERGRKQWHWLILWAGLTATSLFPQGQMPSNAWYFLCMPATISEKAMVVHNIKSNLCFSIVEYMLFNGT